MTAAIPILQTDRLQLRPLSLGDAEAVQAVFPRWEIVRFLAASVPWPYPADGALTYFRDAALPAMSFGREWHWTIRPLDAPDRPIGLVTLRDQPDDNRGYWLAPEWQGRGLATEAADAAADYWFEILGKPVLREPKAIANSRSRRLSERGGMRVVASGHHDFVAGRLPSELWEITREEWRARRRR